MHQVISLFFNPFLILPSEILSLILENMSLDVVGSIQTLSAVDTRMKECLTLSIPYISRLRVDEAQKLELFTGVKHLIVNSSFGNPVSSDMFSSNIWKNMESLDISYRRIAHIEKFLNPKSILDSEHPKSILNSSYFMSNLRCLEIYCSGNECSNIKLVNIPSSLEILKLTGCFVDGIDHFQNLRVLNVEEIELCCSDVQMLNILNLQKLCLVNVGNLNKINIPSLRYLEIVGDIKSVECVEMLNKHNLIELVLYNVEDESDDSQLTDDIPELTNTLSIRSLESLDIHGEYIMVDEKIMENLTNLKISSIRTEDIHHLNIPSLKYLFLSETSGIHPGHLPNITNLNISHSSVILNNVLENLTSLDINGMRNGLSLGNSRCLRNTSTGNDEHYTEISNIVYPALKILNIRGSTDNMKISLNNMSNISINILPGGLILDICPNMNDTLSESLSDISHDSSYSTD